MSMITPIETLKKRDCFIYPTEGVWGIGASVWARGAVAQLNSLKERPVDQDLLCVTCVADSVTHWVDWEKVGQEQKEFYRQYAWDFITFICPTTEYAPYGPFLAIRLSEHPVIAAIEKHIGSPLWSSSANKSGQPPVAEPAQAAEIFPGIPIIDGSLGGQGHPSRIYHLIEKRWLR